MATTPVNPPLNADGSNSSQAESPDMKNARHRLGNVLSGLRRGDQQNPVEVDDFAKPPVAKKAKKDNLFTSEVRLKKVTLSDSLPTKSLYSLARSWAYGREVGDDGITPFGRLPPPDEDPSTEKVPHESVEILSLKEVFRLPDPIPRTSPVPPVLVTASNKPFPVPPNADARTLLNSHMQGWKSCRRQYWMIQANREQPYEKSLHLFRLMCANGSMTG